MAAKKSSTGNNKSSSSTKKAVAASQKRTAQSRNLATRETGYGKNSATMRNVGSAGRKYAATRGTPVGRTEVGLEGTDNPRPGVFTTRTRIKSRRGNMYDIQTAGNKKNPMLSSSARRLNPLSQKKKK